MAEALSDTTQKSVAETTCEEKLYEAQRFKEEGNMFYKKKNLKSAIRNYHLSLLYIKGIEEDHKRAFLCGLMEAPQDMPAELKKEVNNLKITCYNNLAACLLLKENPSCDKIIQYCDQVLLEYPENVKALYRKGMAYFHLKDYDKAKTLLQEAAQLSNHTDSNMQKHINLCNKHLEKYVQKEKERYRAMFDTSKAENSPSSA